MQELEQNIAWSPAEPSPKSTFAEILAEDRHHKPLAYEQAMARMFRNIPIAGRSALDIGSGRGLTTIWLAMQGAQRVVSMEPEMEGSTSGVIQLQRDRLNKLSLRQVEFVTTDFQHYEPDEKFDIVVSNASINHLDESEKNAMHDRDTFESFVVIAKKMKELLNPDGVAVITDASRHGFFSLARAFGMPKRLCYYSKTIEYKIHQNAGTWKKIFLEGGFRGIEIEHPIPHAFRHVEPLFNNAVASFFLQGSFILRARS